MDESVKMIKSDGQDLLSLLRAIQDIEYGKSKSGPIINVVRLMLARGQDCKVSRHKKREDGKEMGEMVK